MSGSSDIRYGRQGGRIVTKRGSAEHIASAPVCTICGRPMVLGQRTAHLVCAQQATEQEIDPDADQLLT